MKNTMKLHGVALTTCVVIALTGVQVVHHTGVDVADSAITCMEEAHDRSACGPVAGTAGMRFWDALAIFAALGWAAGALAYVAGQSAAEQRERKRLAEKRYG